MNYSEIKLKSLETIAKDSKSVGLFHIYRYKYIRIKKSQLTTSRFLFKCFVSHDLRSYIWQIVLHFDFNFSVTIDSVIFLNKRKSYHLLWYAFNTIRDYIKKSNLYQKAKYLELLRKNAMSLTAIPLTKDCHEQNMWRPWNSKYYASSHTAVMQCTNILYNVLCLGELYLNSSFYSVWMIYNNQTIINMSSS